MAFFPWAIADGLFIPISPPTKKQHRFFRRIVERYRNFNNSPSVSDGLFLWLLSDQEGIYVGLHQMWCHKLRTSPTKIWAVWKMHFLLFNFTNFPINFTKLPTISAAEALETPGMCFFCCLQVTDAEPTTGNDVFQQTHSQNQKYLSFCSRIRIFPVSLPSGLPSLKLILRVWK